MAVKFIACEVMKEELLALAPDPGISFDFVSMGLHVQPDKLRAELARLLAATTGVSRIVLGFGQCGGAVNGLSHPEAIVTIPRVHDCIPILLGSRQRYEDLHRQEKGTFYYTRGWIDGMKNSLGDRSITGDWQRSCARYGEAKAKSLLKRMYGGYTRVLYIHTGNEASGKAIARSREIAGLLDLRHEETPGLPDYLDKLLHGPWNDQEFINLTPSGVIEEALFL